MPENANAHDSGDCLPDCTHPDHEYDPDADMTLVLDELWELAQRFRPLRMIRRPVEDLDLPDLEGPVEL